MLPNTQTSEKKDDYQRDGAKYETFRPVYPPQFIQKVREAPKAFNNYLDIATGTGQVLFQLHDRFAQFTVGADITDSVLKVAEEKTNQLKDSLKAGQEFKFVKGNCQKIDEVLKENGIQNKFDLVTIGEAFHWFDMEPLLKTIKEHILEEEGVLSILSYKVPSCELNGKDEELKNRVLQAYDVFYKAVIPFVKFDLEALSTLFKNIPFDKYFNTVQKNEEVDKIPSRLEDVIGHFGTWSNYTSYVQKHSSDSDYKDPLQTLKEALEAIVKEAQANQSLTSDEKPLLTVMSYQLILAHNQKQ